MPSLKGLKERLNMQYSGDIYLPIDPEKSEDRHTALGNGVPRCCRRERKHGALRRVLSIGLTAAMITLVGLTTYSKLHKACSPASIEPGPTIAEHSTSLTATEPAPPVAGRPDELVGDRARVLDEEKPDHDWRYTMYLHGCGGPKLGGGVGNGTSKCLKPQREPCDSDVGFSTYDLKTSPHLPGWNFGVCLYAKYGCHEALTEHPVYDFCTGPWAHSMTVHKINVGDAIDC